MLDDIVTATVVVALIFQVGAKVNGIGISVVVPPRGTIEPFGG